MFHCAGIIPGARVVVATAGLIWEQKGQTHSPLRAHMESLDVLISEEAHQDMDLKSAFVPAVLRQPFYRILLGDPRQSPGGVADNLREHRTLLLKAPIGLRAMNRWLMPQELPAVACSLLKESGEIPLLELAQAAKEVSSKALGDRFCVGSGQRYAFGQADDAANKAREYQFESLHKIYFYDAWRWKIELNQPESPLRLPPRPGLLQNGCYWQQLPYAAHTHNTQDSAALAEISLTEASSDESAEPAPPTEVPEPVSPEANESPTSPITIGSTEEERDGSQPNATEPSEEATPAATIASTSEGDKAHERRTGTVASPDTSAAAFVVEQREQSQGGAGRGN